MGDELGQEACRPSSGFVLLRVSGMGRWKRFLVEGLAWLASRLLAPSCASFHYIEDPYPASLSYLCESMMCSRFLIFLDRVHGMVD